MRDLFFEKFQELIEGHTFNNPRVLLELTFGSAVENVIKDIKDGADYELTQLKHVSQYYDLVKQSVALVKDKLPDDTKIANYHTSIEELQKTYVELNNISDSFNTRQLAK